MKIYYLCTQIRAPNEHKQQVIIRSHNSDMLLPTIEPQFCNYLIISMLFLLHQ